MKPKRTRPSAKKLRPPIREHERENMGELRQPREWRYGRPNRTEREDMERRWEPRRRRRGRVGRRMRYRLGRRRQ